MTLPTLPGLRVEWEQAEPGDGETFVHYNVYRRRASHTGPFGDLVPAGPRVRIAAIADIGTLEFTDHHVGSVLGYTYAVTWTANIAGTVLESDEQAMLAAGVVTFRGSFLHDPAHPTVYTPVLASEVRVEQRQQQATLRARGRREETVFVGEGFGRAYDLQLVPDAHTDRAPYERIRAMLDRQYTQGAVYCLRLGSTGDVVFGRLEGLRRDHRPGLTTPAARFVEVAHQEAA